MEKHMKKFGQKMGKFEKFGKYWEKLGGKSEKI